MAILAIIPQINKKHSKLIFPLTILLAITQAFFIYLNQKEKETERYTGVLEPMNKNDEKYFIPSQNLYINLGGNIFAMSRQKGKKKTIKFNGTKIYIEFEENKLNVSVIIRDKKGIVVAELIKNEWSINKFSHYERNFTKNALEVKDETGDIILQVFFKNSHTILIRGKLYGPNGQMVFVGERGMHFNPTKEVSLKPLFLYPSKTHLGKFRDKLIE